MPTALATVGTRTPSPDSSRFLRENVDEFTRQRLDGHNSLCASRILPDKILKLFGVRGDGVPRDGELEFELEFLVMIALGLPLFLRNIISPSLSSSSLELDESDISRLVTFL